jgi:hypothetical protein
LIWLPIVFKVPTDTDVFSVPNFRFRCFRNTDIVSVSEVTVSDFVSDKKYGNGDGFSVFRSFPFSPLMTSSPSVRPHAISRVHRRIVRVPRRCDGARHHSLDAMSYSRVLPCSRATRYLAWGGGGGVGNAAASPGVQVAAYVDLTCSTF